jgi:antitoxin (DNA-binding transcriptional repressor) of toxin-antitoxin stability system
MRSAGIRELKNHLSEYLRRLRPGQVIAVTDRGRVVAELRAPATTDSAAHSPLTGRYAALVEAGVIRRARESGDPLEAWPTPREVKLPAGSAATLLDEDRGG